MRSSHAPIAFFAYKRPAHARRALQRLQACREYPDTDVFVFVDGPRSSSDAGAVAETLRAVEALRTSNMTVTALPTNRGLAASIIAEVSTLCASHGRVIVVEDDLLVEPATLAWLNAGLNAYADDDRVMQISAYQYRVPEFEDRQSGVFQHIAMTWGWATWHRAWSRFDPDANGWREVENRGRTRSDFNAGDAYPFSQMLIKQMTGRLDSWGIRWSWSVFRAGGVTLMPPRSLVTNEGFQEGATHNSVGWAKRFVSGAQPRLWRDEEPPCMPDDVHVSPADESAFRRGLLRTRARRNARVKAVLAWFGFRQFR